MGNGADGDIGRPQGNEGVTAVGDAGSETCRFCAVLRGEAPVTGVFADEISLAFLDHRPLFPGHTLLIPRLHCQTLTELPEELTGRFFGNVRLLAGAVETAMAAHGSFVAMNNRVSQSVPHLHVHIVPRSRHDGLKGFFWPRHPYESEQEMARVADMVRASVARLEAQSLHT